MPCSHFPPSNTQFTPPIEKLHHHHHHHHPPLLSLPFLCRPPSPSLAPSRHYSSPPCVPPPLIILRLFLLGTHPLELPSSLPLCLRLSFWELRFLYWCPPLSSFFFSLSLSSFLEQSSVLHSIIRKHNNHIQTHPHTHAHTHTPPPPCISCVSCVCRLQRQGKQCLTEGLKVYASLLFLLISSFEFGRIKAASGASINQSSSSYIPWRSFECLSGCVSR